MSQGEGAEKMNDLNKQKTIGLEEFENHGCSFSTDFDSIKLSKKEFREYTEMILQDAELQFVQDAKGGFFENYEIYYQPSVIEDVQ